MAAVKKDLVITQGSTFNQVVRWETSPTIFKEITAITQGAPTKITVPGHGLVDGWRAKFESVKGTALLNDDTYRQVTVVDVNNVIMPELNTSGMRAYAGGGVLAFNTQHDLTGYTARMSIKDRVGGTELLRLDTTNGGIAIDAVAGTVTLTVSATTSAGLSWSKGVYDLELVSPTGAVTALLSGGVAVTKEVTTT